jgi:Patatin-like phospholipase
MLVMRYAPRLGFVLLLASALSAPAMLSTSLPSIAAEKGKPAKAQPAGARGNTGAAQPAADIKLEARIAYDEKQAASAEIPGIPQARFAADAVEDFVQALPTAEGPWLALSGGGAEGAFGTGLLAGWSHSGTRPEFALVTGVSTGALMAPFVFLGPRYDDQLRQNYTKVTAADVFEAGMTGESLLSTWPLKDMIAKQVTHELLAEIAAAHRAGRRLFVVTTDLDSGKAVAWNMGAIAEAGDEAALGLFRSVLLASGSMPGLFPPVLVNVRAQDHVFHEMHADGTIAAPFYLGPQEFFTGSKGRVPAGTEVYVIANSKLEPGFGVTERETAAVLGRSIALAFKAGLRMQLARFAEAARNGGFALHVAAVDPGFDKVSRGAFDPEYMGALYDRAAKQGESNARFCQQLPCAPNAQASAGGGPVPQ